MFPHLPPVSDTLFSIVTLDMAQHPMSSMKACAARTGVSYGSVIKVSKHLRAEGSLVRRRIGQRAGIGLTFANLIVTSPLDR